ncbi:MAG: hypothetical protein IJ315_10340, partial [Firmicutes bacterium]|nr:hypothetical protein [Bacillota bacterium]
YAEAANAWEMYGDYDIARIFYDYTFYILPMANPDVYQISNHGEDPLWYDGILTAEDRHDYSCNGNGANLNRNFPFEWEYAEEGTEPAIAEGKGPYGGSEPETQALMELCAEHYFQWMYSFHNYGHCIFWQDTYNGVIDGDVYLAEGLEEVCGFYLPPATSDPAGYGGGFENWFRAEFGRPGFCVELGLLDYEPSIFISDFEEAIVWENTKYAMLIGTE